MPATLERGSSSARSCSTTHDRIDPSPWGNDKVPSGYREQNGAPPRLVPGPHPDIGELLVSRLPGDLLDALRG